MNKKIDIHKFQRRIPFLVPNGYFQKLKFEIQNKCIAKEKGSSFSIFNSLVPAIGILLFFITLFNNIETTNSEVKITDHDLIVYLENNISDQLLNEYSILEDENEDDELSDEFDYLFEHDIDYILFFSLENKIFIVNIIFNVLRQ